MNAAHFQGTSFVFKTMIGQISTSFDDALSLLALLVDKLKLEFDFLPFQVDFLSNKDKNDRVDQNIKRRNLNLQVTFPTLI